MPIVLGGIYQYIPMPRHAQHQHPMAIPSPTCKLCMWTPIHQALNVWSWTLPHDPCPLPIHSHDTSSKASTPYGHAIHDINILWPCHPQHASCACELLYIKHSMYGHGRYHMIHAPSPYIPMPRHPMHHHPMPILSPRYKVCTWTAIHQALNVWPWALSHDTWPRSYIPMRHHQMHDDPMAMPSPMCKLCTYIARYRALNVWSWAWSHDPWPPSWWKAMYVCMYGPIWWAVELDRVAKNNKWMAGFQAPEGGACQRVAKAHPHTKIKLAHNLIMY